MFQVAVLLISALKMSRWKVLFSSTLPTAHFCQNSQYAELSKAGKQHLFVSKVLISPSCNFRNCMGTIWKPEWYFFVACYLIKFENAFTAERVSFLDGRNTNGVPFKTRNLTFVVWTQFCFVTRIPNRHGKKRDCLKHLFNIYHQTKSPGHFWNVPVPPVIITCVFFTVNETVVPWQWVKVHV